MKNFTKEIKELNIMKKQIRVGVFETNSSMTHALTICTEEQYDKWKNGEIFWDKWNDRFAEREELMKQFNEDVKRGYWIGETTEEGFDEWRMEDGIVTFDEDCDDDCYFEDFEEHFTTPSGDEMVAFGCYGHD
jgi:hypothetical protein